MRKKKRAIVWLLIVLLIILSLAACKNKEKARNKEVIVSTDDIFNDGNNEEVEQVKGAESPEDVAKMYLAALIENEYEKMQSINKSGIRYRTVDIMSTVHCYEGRKLEEFKITVENVNKVEIVDTTNDLDKETLTIVKKNDRYYFTNISNE